jgi:2-polyprenyl-3-methyl-5-hydroxy-6-metoxy-1,4-benzoquinol methylase
VTSGDAPDEAAYTRGIYVAEEPRLSGAVRSLQRLLSGKPARALARAGVRPGAAVLDAGAGHGNLLRVLQARGYRAEGIDPSPRGPGIVRAGIEDHVAADLDAVVLWHVLEHLPNPAAALQRVRGWLRPGGVVVIGVPNAASLQARIAGAEWFHLDLPRHRTHFTTGGLGELIARTGLAQERTHHVVAEHNFYGMWFALLGRLGMTPGFPFHLVKRNVPVSARDLLLLLVAGPLLLLPAIVLELAAAALRRGGTVAVVARAQISS